MKKITKFNDLDTKGKITRVFKIIFFYLFLIATILVFIFFDEIYGASSVFNTEINNAPGFVNWIYQRIPAAIASVQAIILAIVLTYIVKGIMKLVLRKTKKTLTIALMLTNFFKWIIAIITFLAILSIWGIDTTTILASAGVMTLIIGLGAQSLIADILAGLFLVFEEEFEIGDIVVIDGFKGTVTEIGIRCTQLTDTNGDVKYINNNTISTLINKTKHATLVKCEIVIQYNNDLSYVEKITKENSKIIAKKLRNLLDGPYYQGVSALQDSGVVILITAKTKEAVSEQVKRELLKEFKLLYEKSGIVLTHRAESITPAIPESVPPIVPTPEIKEETIEENKLPKKRTFNPRKRYTNKAKNNDENVAAKKKTTKKEN